MLSFVQYTVQRYKFLLNACMATHTIITSGYEVSGAGAEGHERLWTGVEPFHLPINFFLYFDVKSSFLVRFVLYFNAKASKGADWLNRPPPLQSGPENTAARGSQSSRVPHPRQLAPWITCAKKFH